MCVQKKSGSSSDNDSEFSETSSKRAKKVASGTSYRSNEISKKHVFLNGTGLNVHFIKTDVKRLRNEESFSCQSDNRDSLSRKPQINNTSI